MQYFFNGINLVFEFINSQCNNLGILKNNLEKIKSSPKPKPTLNLIRLIIFKKQFILSEDHNQAWQAREFSHFNSPKKDPKEKRQDILKVKWVFHGSSSAKKSAR